MEKPITLEEAFDEDKLAEWIMYLMKKQSGDLDQELLEAASPSEYIN